MAKAKDLTIHDIFCFNSQKDLFYKVVDLNLYRNVKNLNYIFDFICDGVNNDSSFIIGDTNICEITISKKVNENEKI